MNFTLPAKAAPYEVAILLVYLWRSRKPREIAAILHYKQPRPVEKVLKRYRPFLAELLEIQATGTVLVSVT